MLTGSAEQYLLWCAYPGLRPRIARECLLNGYTEVHKLTHLSEANLWIKRDDQTSKDCGGTKVRKLELLLGEARALNKSNLVAIGAMGSHFLLTAAVFAKQMDLKMEAIVCDQPATEQAHRNVLALLDHSVKLSYKGKSAPGYAYFLARKLKKGRGEYFLPAGGSSPLGTLGIVNAVFELKAQIERGDLPAPQRIVSALGSGGTLAGLALGVALTRLPCEVVGVRVYPAWVGPFPTATAGRVSRLITSTSDLLRRMCPAVPKVRIHPPQIVGGYLGSGYAMPTPIGELARRYIYDSEGIELDSTYTAKTFAAVLDLCSASPCAGPTLYWHTLGSVSIASTRSGPDTC